MVVLENNQLKIEINAKGAELFSLKNKQNGVEHLWHGDPSIWAFRAPNLFPIVGSCLHNEILVDGKRYPIKRHGFARHSHFELIDQRDSEAKFNLKFSDETLNQYPFKFSFNIHYKLESNRLSILYEVINLDDKSIYFSLGAHPAFKIPFHSNDVFSDYYLEFNEDQQLEQHLLGKDGYFNGHTTSIELDSNKLHLSPDLFKNDALVFKKLKSRIVKLKSHKSSNLISLSFPDFESLGIWAPMGAPFVCIEPWLGYADNEGDQKEFRFKEAILNLAVEGTFIAQYDIEIS